MDPGHHARSSWGGFRRLKMKGYGSEMGSVHGMSTSASEVLQEMWKKSKGLYDVREWKKMTRDAGHHRTWGAENTTKTNVRGLCAEC
jgi:hypothetical protein